MTTDAAIRFFALLTALANLAVLARVVTAPLGRRVAVVRAWAEEVGRYARPLACAVATVTAAGSLYFSEVAHYTPCRLCWYQRITLYPIAVVLGVGLLRREPASKWYAIPLAALTVPISSYHYLIEWYPQLETTSCEPTVPCTAVWFREFGFMSLSYMALSAALLLIVLLTLPSPSQEPS